MSVEDREMWCGVMLDCNDDPNIGLAPAPHGQPMPTPAPITISRLASVNTDWTVIVGWGVR